MITNSDRPILIVGYGSIGRRHLRNLKSLGFDNFILSRSGKSTLPDDEIVRIPAFTSLKKALAFNPIVTVITNPTSLHMEAALAAARAGSHIFIEKPISDSMDGVEALRRIVSKKRLVASVGFHYRFHPLLQKVKKLIDDGAIGNIVGMQVHWGQYLPDWHPWEDYRKGYSARSDLGGGALHTLCHPFDYLRYLLGDVSYVSSVLGRAGGLGIDVEDTADVHLRFKSGATGNVHLNYLDKPESHYLQIIGQSGVIYFSNTKGVVRVYSRKVGTSRKFVAPKKFERNTMYVDEMRNFFGCIFKKENLVCSLADGVEALKIVLAAEESAKKKKLIKI